MVSGAGCSDRVLELAPTKAKGRVPWGPGRRQSRALAGRGADPVSVPPGVPGSYVVAGAPALLYRVHMRTSSAQVCVAHWGRETKDSTYPSDRCQAGHLAREPEPTSDLHSSRGSDNDFFVQSLSCI